MIPHEDWLDQAKRLAVGMKLRVRHRNEGRMNMVIGNDTDKWWCYCQRCKEGAVVEKSHVILGQVGGPVDTDVMLPPDITPLQHTEFEVPVARFLADKCMAFPYLPNNLYYSGSRKRLMLNIEGRWHGRDLTGRSTQKWMNYNNAKYVGHPGTNTVLVEDLFSMFKTRWAMRGDPSVHVMCSLGTGCHTPLVAALAGAAHVRNLIWFYDADEAGDDGVSAGTRRMNAYGIRQCRSRPPEGLDPKDMRCEDIRLLIQAAKI